MRHGIVVLPEYPWPRAAEAWRRVEELGFDHAWTYDHLSWFQAPDRPWFGVVPTLTVAALSTSRIRLGPLVANPGLHHPATLARDLMTVDQVAGGRLTCAVGAGGHDDTALAGRDLSPDERAGRFTEFVTLVDALLRGRAVDHHGRHYACRDVALVGGGGPVPRMPLAVAASGPQGLRLAARFADTWVTAGARGRWAPLAYADAVPVVRAQLAALEDACAAEGRDPATVDRLVLTGASIAGVLDSAAAFEDASGQFADAGFTDLVVHRPRETFPFRGRIEVLEEIAARSLTGRTGKVPVR